MSTIAIVLLIILGVILLIAIGAVVSYNRFVTQRNLVRESWRQIDVELQRRHDLIPNLIETVKGFAAQERNVLMQVTEARNMAENVRRAPGIQAEAQAQAENQLSGALGRLIAVSEAYPDLKSNQNFLELQRQLEETEDRVAAGRRFYNGNVRALNTRVEAFPSNITAGAFKFTKEQYFEVDDPQVRAAVRVDFGGMNAPMGQPAPGPYAGQPAQLPAPQPQYGGVPGVAPQPQPQYAPPPGQPSGQPGQYPAQGYPPPGQPPVQPPPLPPQTPPQAPPQAPPRPPQH